MRVKNDSPRSSFANPWVFFCLHLIVLVFRKFIMTHWRSRAYVSSFWIFYSGMRSERNYYLNLCIRQPFSSRMTIHRDGGNKKSPHQLIYLRLEKEKKEGPLQEPVFASDRPTSLFEWHVRINFPRFARRQKGSYAGSTLFLASICATAKNWEMSFCGRAQITQTHLDALLPCLYRWATPF